MEVGISRTDDSVISVKTRLFIFDTPARALVLNIKNVPGYHSCHKCTIRGEYLKSAGSTCFADDRMAVQRTHEDFLCKTFFSNDKKESHHLTQHETVLERLLTFNIVDQTVIDFMHVCCIGAMKRILEIVGDSPNFNSVANIFINAAKAYIPQEFQRIFRTLDYLKCYKATEYRFWILYFGIIAFYEALSSNEFENFCYLVHGLRLLYIKPLTAEIRDVSKACIRRFIGYWKINYPNQNVTYVLHAMQHLPDDCYMFKSTPDEISAFPFESYIRRVKDNYHKGPKALEQIYCRFVEEVKLFKHHKFSKTRSDEIQCITHCGDGYFEELCTPKFTLKKGIGNNVIKVKDKIMFCSKFKEEGDCLIFFGCTYELDSTEFYILSQNKKASDVGIFVIDFNRNRKKEDDFYKCMKSDVSKSIDKMVTLPLDISEPYEKFLVVNYLH